MCLAAESCDSNGDTAELHVSRNGSIRSLPVEGTPEGRASATMLWRDSYATAGGGTEFQFLWLQREDNSFSNL